jgi:predicted O-methyltransferase YrrM
MNCDTNDWPIPTWTEPETLSYLADLAKNAEFAVESGTYMGASARAMLMNSDSLHLWCVDKFEVFGTEAISRMFLHNWIAKGRCELIIGDTDRAFAMLPHMLGKLDFAWVDDGHAYDDLRRDIRTLLPLVKPGGKLVFHDFDIPHNDVAKGILSMLPANQLEFPLPRMCAYRKPA